MPGMTFIMLLLYLSCTHVFNMQCSGDHLCHGNSSLHTYTHVIIYIDFIAGISDMYLCMCLSLSGSTRTLLGGGDKESTFIDYPMVEFIITTNKDSLLHSPRRRAMIIRMQSAFFSLIEIMMEARSE